MLKYFFEQDLVRYIPFQVKSWEEAIYLSCENLKAKNIVSDKYAEEIVSCVKEYGPYIVIVPEVAIPHSTATSNGVLGTAIAFTKLIKPVSFDPTDPDKTAQLFFTLAAKNPEEHMENIQKLSEMLMIDGLIDDLCATTNLADFQKVMNVYNI